MPDPVQFRLPPCHLFLGFALGLERPALQIRNPCFRFGVVPQCLLPDHILHSPLRFLLSFRLFRASPRLLLGRKFRLTMLLFGQRPLPGDLLGPLLLDVPPLNQVFRLPSLCLPLSGCCFVHLPLACRCVFSLPLARCLFGWVG